MGINEILLVIAALAPAIFLCVYVYKKDRADKEPLGILLLLLGLGVAISIPAIVLEIIFGGIIDVFFYGDLPIPEYGTDFTYTLYQFCSNTLGVALVEEGLKWIVLLLVTKKTKHFNSLFDSIIYAVFVSLGFAAFENVLYVLQNGWVNAIMRAVLSVPGHMFFAVLMGCYYSSYHTTRLAHQTEIECRRKGLIDSTLPEFSEKKHLLMSLLIPTLVHGFYNFCLSMGQTFYLLVDLALVICLYVHCFGRIKSTSKQDTHTMLCVLKLLETKYPGFANIAEQAGILPQDNSGAGMMPTLPLETEPSAKANVKYAGIYTRVSGTVQIVAPLKQSLPAGATLVTVQTAAGERLPITANVVCQVEKYNVRDGESVSASQLLGVLKYSV